MEDRLGLRNACATLAVALAVIALAPPPARAQTAAGEIEGRPAPVSRRQCVGGANAGRLCNDDAGCPGSSCQDRNVFNLTVGVRFNASAAQLTTIRNAFTNGSALWFDATDGQAEIGQVTLVNNATGAAGTVWVVNGGGCSADTGTWGSYSAGNVSLDIASLSGAAAAGCVAHELSHLIFDVRDEYESRAAGCGAVSGSANCPHLSSGELACLMECCGRIGTEFCWGQGNPANLTDLSGGNHDPSNVTEQSVCRANRSCWDQIGFSWPNTMQVPAGAPDPAAGGATVDPIVFVEPVATSRIVLVLDRSGSMTSESPARIERLRTAALGFVGLAPNGMELGLVSFSSTASDEVAIGALGANRAAYTTAIGGLAASGATNIGDGLRRARDMIIAAGGVTAQTAIVLMTDGRNNRPAPAATAAADLQAALAQLLADGIPVLVTCTGDDLGLDSQCAEIATATGGSYVDSADAGDLARAFADFHEQVLGRQITRSVEEPVKESGGSSSHAVMVEPGAGVATFALLWKDAQTLLGLVVTDPRGMPYQGLSIPQGQYVRVAAPIPGMWTVQVNTLRRTAADEFLARSYLENQSIALGAAVLPRRVAPGEAFRVRAHPKYLLSLRGVTITGTVELPDGSSVPIALADDGRTGTSGDDVPDDGIYSTTFTNTAQTGAYTFHLRAEAVGAEPALEVEPGTAAGPVKPVDFAREARLSAAVAAPVAATTDHFRCYRAKAPRKSRFEGRTVQLRDQFGAVTASVVRPVLLCNPADKDGEGLVDRTAHLVCYATRDREKPRSKRKPVPVKLTNQFGEEIAAVRTPGLLCVPSEKDEVASSLNLDHFRCYAAPQREGKFAPRPVTLRDQFGETASVVGKPQILCAPADKNGEGIVDPDTHLRCHRTKDRKPRRTEARTVAVRNQFGSGSLTIGQATHLCVPSTKTVLGPTTTTTTTATTSSTTSSTRPTTTSTLPPAPPCGEAGARTCDGACPGLNEACVGTPNGPCECRPTDLPCGSLAEAPLCHGFCPPEKPLCVDVQGECRCLAP